jgi:SAM-dependent methyltransferase
MLRTAVLALALSGCATVSPATVTTPAEEHPHPGERPHQGEHSWDATYARGTGFKREPNALLVSAVSGRTPGSALDVGMGQGRNALFLARAGWKVTGVDPALEGVRQAKEAARAAGVPLDAIAGTIEDYELGRERFDLIALLYVGGAELAQRISTALKPGGLVVVEYFHKDMERAFHHAMGAFDTGELERLFPTFEVLRSEVVEDTADFGLERSKLVRFVARKR